MSALLEKSDGAYRCDQEISEYYRQTWIDFVLVWSNPTNLALHFGYYDGRTSSHAESLSYANEVLANVIELAQGEHVLDAGCGVGGSSFWLAEHRGATTTGIALGPEQIALAVGEARRRCLSDKCTFLTANFEQLPFPAKSFDVVWAQESLCHSADKAAFFKEAYRVLRPGGRIIIADFFLRSLAIDACKQSITREWLEGWRIPMLWTAAQHINAASTAQFSNVSVSDVTAHTVRSHLRLYQLAVLAMPLAVFLKRTQVRSHVQNGNVIAALRQYQALKGDCWFYGILTAYK